DAVGLYLRAQGVNNWWLLYVYAPIQIVMLLAVVARSREVRLVLTLGFVWTALLSAMRGPLTAQEVVIQGTGGLVVWFLAWQNRDVRAFEPALRAYCLWATGPLVGMALAP